MLKKKKSKDTTLSVDESSCDNFQLTKVDSLQNNPQFPSSLHDELVKSYEKLYDGSLVQLLAESCIIISIYNICTIRISSLLTTIKYSFCIQSELSLELSLELSCCIVCTNIGNFL